MMKVAFLMREDLDYHVTVELIREYIEFEIDETKPEYIFCCGGDGTFLDAVVKYGSGPTYVPINMGTLGFYSSWGRDSLDVMVSDLKFNRIINAPMLEISIFDDKVLSHKYYCLNEATIINPVNTQILDVYINDFEIEKFRGTGLCVSTPTGSTAYNKSLGGAIISSRKKLFQLTHIAAINNVKYRNIGNSIILDESELLTFKAHYKDFKNSVLTVDRTVHQLDGSTSVEIKLSDRVINILVPESNEFYKRVRKAFID